MTEVTIGLDIGTTSVKAVAVDGDGVVLRRARVPHDLHVPAPDMLEHDAVQAWRDGPVRALAQVGTDGARGIAIAAMVPSCTAVDDSGTPLTPGLLYGDRRGRTGHSTGNPAVTGESRAFLDWTAKAAPEARGYWPAQAVASVVLGGPPVVDLGVAASSYPIFTGVEWDAKALAEIGLVPEQMPLVAPAGSNAGTIAGLPLAPGSVDALGEQLVAGVEEPGEVLVLCGTTLITWSVMDAWREEPGLWSIPHHIPGRFLVGGPSNAGGLFLNWARRLVGEAPGGVDAARVPVFAPYIRGERTPLHDPDRRAALDGLDLTMGAAAVRRAAYEAAGFVVRHHIDLGRTDARRIVATGGGVQDAGWVQALADCTGLPVDVVAVPEGGALGTAWLARMAAGLETSIVDARRWAKVARTVEPDPAYAPYIDERYARFRALTATP